MRKLKKLCKRCGKMYEPKGKFNKICLKCYKPVGGYSKKRLREEKEKYPYLYGIKTPIKGNRKLMVKR